MAVAEYLSQLQKDKKALIKNLSDKGVEVKDSETFTTLVPKVATIETASPIEDYIVIEPSTDHQTFLPAEGYDGIGRVELVPVRSNIDENIIPENIKEGATILGITGTYDGVADLELQYKTVSSTASPDGVDVTYDSQYDALGKVHINPIKASQIPDLRPDIIKRGEEVLEMVGTYGPTSQSKIVAPSKDRQIIAPDSGVEYLQQVEVLGVTSAIDSNIQANNIKDGVTILGVEGIYTGTKLYQDKTAALNTEKSIVYTADPGYDALSSVTVPVVTARIDGNIQSGNIRKGVEILGVTGTYEPDPSQTMKYITPQVYKQEISPDSGYSTMDKVTVYGVSSSIDSNIKAANIRKGVKILGVTGNIEPVNGAQITIEPQTVEQFLTPPEDKNAITEVIVKPVTSTIDDKIIASNIKEGISILGVEGTFNGGISSLQTKHVTPKEGAQEVTADDGYDALSVVIVDPTPVETIEVSPSIENKTYYKNDGVFIDRVEVAKVTSDIDVNIQPENIKQNMSILGVVGTYAGEPTPTYFEKYAAGGYESGGHYLPGVLKNIIKLPDNIVVTGTSAECMFSMLSGLKELPLIDLTNITNMRQFAYQCSSLVTIPQLNTSNVTNMYEAFYETGITEIPNLDYSKVTDMTGAFYKTKISTIPTNLHERFPNVTSWGKCFGFCPFNVTGHVDFHICGASTYPIFYSAKSVIPSMDFYIHDRGGSFSSTKYSSSYDCAFFYRVNRTQLIVHYVNGGCITSGRMLFGSAYDSCPIRVNSITRVNSDTPMTFNMVGLTDCEYTFSYAFGDDTEPVVLLPDVQELDFGFEYNRQRTLFLGLSTKAKSIRRAFYNNNYMTSLYGPEIDTPIEMGGITNIQSDTFSTIPKLVNCGGLKDIGKAFTQSTNSSYHVVNFSSCSNLSHDSLMNIINNAWDLAASGKNAQKLMLGATNLAKLTAEEIAIATNKGWNVS